MDAVSLVATPRSAGATERRGAIAQEIQHRGRATVAELSRQFGVSQVSVRQDLARLERAGLVKRVRGGARAVSDGAHIPSFDVRLLQGVAVKQAIGRAASELIHPGDIVFLDAGTTVLEVARSIPRPLLESGNLTVVTRSAMILSHLRGRRRTRLIVLGGVYVPDFDDFVGEEVENALRAIRVDTLFIGTDGLSLERGVTTDNVLETGLYRLMARCAKRLVLVTDSGKIGRDQFQVILPLDAVDTLITDDGAPPDFAKALRARGMQVILVPRP